MKWIKRGLIFKPTKNKHGWISSHAMLPTAENIRGDRYRIFFAPRDKMGRSHIASIEIDIKKSKKILNISKKPVLSPGELGAFDDSGALPSSLIAHSSKLYMYYIGYNIGVTVPFRNFIGLAVKGRKGGNFHKISKGPLLERNNIDPYLTVTPCVLLENGIWRMWYASITKWAMKNNKPRHYYHIKYAESSDGIEWDRKGVVCIDYKNSAEYAIARPSVLRDGKLYRMWYCYRGGNSAYRIGYAESNNGLAWMRMDEKAGIDVSSDGWDSEMVCYPFVFRHKGLTYMLYNGNGYGETGIGLATLEK